MKESFSLRRRLQTYFIAGILTLVPVVVTVYVVYLLTSFSLRWLVILPTQAVASYLPQVAALLVDPVGRLVAGGLSILIGISLVAICGYLATGAFGRFAGRLWNEIIGRLPLVSSLYNALQQVFDMIFGNNTGSFRKVALVKYPVETSYAIGFVSNEIEIEGKGRCYSVFVPTTPNPTSGFCVMVPVGEATILDITVEEAMKYVVSLGMIVPKLGIGAAK